MMDTIFALASGPLPCGVAIVRVSGPKVRDCIRAFCRRDLPARQAIYVPIRLPDSGGVIDQGLAIFFPGPQSFTGEDCLEFHVHGSRAVVALLLRTLGDRPGLRLAVPGEFIRRAFENGKLPLTSVEGLADLLDARTELQRQQALAQAGGRLADRAGIWREMLLEARALVEAEIDFADEGDAPTDVMDQVLGVCTRLIVEWTDALRDADRGELIKNGFRVVIAGPPNVGKSSLMNALVRRTVAIVTEYAGTTRDIIEVEMDLGGTPVVLCDTAGLRAAANPVEAIGIGLSQHAIESASLVLLLDEAHQAKPIRIDAPAQAVLVASKCDLAARPAWAEVGISTRDGTGLDELVGLIANRASSAVGEEPTLVTHERQRVCLRSARGLLDLLLAEPMPVEIVADHLRLACRQMEALTGRIDSDVVLGEIFGRFCMGK